MIAFTPGTAMTQVSNLINRYPDLKVSKSDFQEIRLRGIIHIYRTALQFTLDRSYEIEIKIPLNSDSLPIAIDAGDAIDRSYPHRYPDGELCLETETAIRLRFSDGFELIPWMEEYVEPYYFSYEYYTRFGSFPFGERPHGIVEGILNTYQGLFNESDVERTVTLLKFCAENKYRGHVNCPCKSGKRLRVCHGTAVFPLMVDCRKREIVKNDLKTLRKELERYVPARKNQEASK